MLQSSNVSDRPDVWLRCHLHALLQGARAGHPAERGGLSGHWPGHRHALWPSHHAGAQRGPLYGWPAAGPAGGRGYPGGHGRAFRQPTALRLGASGRAAWPGHAVCCAHPAMAASVYHAVHSGVWCSSHHCGVGLLCGALCPRSLHVRADESSAWQAGVLADMGGARGVACSHTAGCHHPVEGDSWGILSYQG